LHPDQSFFYLDLAYEYDHAELGFSIPHLWVSSIHTPPSVEPLISATMEGGQDGISQPPSPFSFPSPTSGNLSHELDFSHLGFLVLILIRVNFYFPAHEVLSSEIARDDILADLSALADVVSSGFCTDSAVAGLYALF
jgi:hypothetical protein